MQKNSLDHWIRNRFLFQYQVYCNSYPYLPIGAKVASPHASSPYKYQITLRNEQSYHEFSQRLRADQITYTPEVSHRSGFWVKLVEPDEYDSLTTRWFWRLVQLGTFFVLSIYRPVDNLIRLLCAFITKA